MQLPINLGFGIGRKIALALVVSGASLTLLTLAPGANAQVIPDRTTLNALLVTSNTEDFEALNIAPGDADAEYFTGGFDSNSLYNGQGPGLVNSDISFLSNGDAYQWNAQGYFGRPTQDFLANSPILTVNFLSTITAFGIDLSAYQGFPSTAGITVYDGVGNVVYSTVGLAIPDATDVNGYVIPTFFGYQSAGGIGKVDFTGETYGWSPLIDNLTYGTAGVSDVPEPGAVAFGVMAAGSVLGLVARKRKK